MDFIISLHIGTSNVVALLLDEKGKTVAIEKSPISFMCPYHDHVELNPEEVFSKCLSVIQLLFANNEVRVGQVRALGLSNVPGTTVLWNKITGEPLWNIISWNDTRGRSFCNKYKLDQDWIQKKTGRVLSTYSSVSKIRSVIDRTGIKKIDDFMFGTLNTWLLWKLTDKGIYATDMVNACNTSLFNIHDNSWDKELIDLFELKESMLPEVLSCSEVYGYVHEKYFGAKIPICSMIDTPQGALFGAGCHQKGEGHISLGTGSFISINTGEQIVKVPGELTATVALARKDEPIKYSILGSIYSSGSVIDWLKMHLGIIKSAKEIEGLAYSVPDSGGGLFCAYAKWVFLYSY